MNLLTGQRRIEEIERYIIKQAIVMLLTVTKSFDLLPDSNERFHVLRDLRKIRRLMKKIQVNGKLTGL